MTSHVLGNDGHGHGGALLCGTAEIAGTRYLFARSFVPAMDGIDYVPGTVGHHALTPGFVRRVLRLAKEHRLVPLLVHSHGHGQTVRFSETDLGSHERGYPALLDISAQSVGALVLATHAVAGDIWLDTGGRAELDVATVIGPNIVRVTPSREAVPSHREQDDRQARVFGDRGQAILRRAKVGVVGTGGGGMLAVEYLARLGVGELVVIDPDRVDLTNLSRLPGATRLDAMAWLTSTSRPAWLRRLGARLAAPKVRIAKRLAGSAGQGTRVTTIRRSVQHPAAVNALLDCDYIVLAADSAIARHITNIISHQYLVPMVQVGVKVPVDDDGAVGDLFTATRTVLPDRGCLRCAELIDATKLATESLPDAERRQADYGTGQPAPSVITLNAIGVSEAITTVMFALTGLNQRSQATHIRHHARRGARKTGVPRRDAHCPVCGESGRVALGALIPIPTSARRDR
jgi:molybdopterin/thiamine biosynthesis adenylyltransferase